MSKEENQKNDGFSPYRSYMLLFISIILTIIAACCIFIEIKNLFKESLQQKVLTIAQTGVLIFNPAELDEISGQESVGTKAYEDTVKRLLSLRQQNPKLRFVDIYRKTDKENLFEYVADADSLHPDVPIDLNGDGIINDEDALNYPGDIYDGSDVPNFVQNAFVKGDVDPDLESSQWGLTLDASEPIFDKDGKANYVLNVDVDVNEFTTETNIALIPFVIFVVVLILILVAQTVALVKMWKSRVKFLTELDKQKDELLGLVSHQLATPVSGLRWNLEMFLDGDLGPMNDQQKEEMTTMQGVVGNLSDLVSMILDVSRIQLGRMKVDKTEIDLHEFIKEMIDVLEPKSKDKKQTFTVNMPPEKTMGYIDKRLSHMTIENLISNAVKYTPEGGTITIDAVVKDDILHCSVVDTGMGIPKKDQDKIFGKLYRASNVAAVDGNGFGLYVAKGAIESQGGKIWFESEEGKGTKFFVDLPINEPPKRDIQSK